jgi:hypothetical protein
MPKKGYKHTAEARAKMRGRFVNDATRAKMRAAQKNRPPISPETRAKISATSRGRSLSTETRTKIGLALRGHHLGHVLSAESRIRISNALRGRPVSAETRAKIGAAVWRGGTKSGYEYIHVGKFVVFQHRLVMANCLGQRLKAGTHVHHVNKNRKDNRTENLALCSDSSAHRWCHSEEARIFFG